MYKLLLTLFLSVSLDAQALDAPLPLTACVALTPYGLPVTQKQRTTKICRTGYVLEHDDVHHVPVWVAYSLTPDQATGCYPRVSHFVPEPGLPPGASAQLKDYAKHGYDIGHQANDSDMRWSKLTEEESNIFANAAPQLPEFNRGIWKKLEDTTRGWAISRGHKLKVYIAPVVNAQDKAIGVDQVIVPHAFVKVLVDTQTNEVLAFLFKHEGSKADLSTFVTSLAEAQRQSGVIFPVPPNAVLSTTIWPVTLKSNRAAKSNVCLLK
jgi:endonuclease G